VSLPVCLPAYSNMRDLGAWFLGSIYLRFKSSKIKNMDHIFKITRFLKTQVYTFLNPKITSLYQFAFFKNLSMD
jgi:hypothetical protein